MIEVYLFDWDELLMVLMGFAAMAYVMMEHRRDRADTAMLMSIAERLGRLEANSDDSVALEGRLVALEAAVAVSDRHEERLAGVQERLARLEVFIDGDEELDDDEE